MNKSGHPYNRLAGILYKKQKMIICHGNHTRGGQLRDSDYH